MKKALIFIVLFLGLTSFLHDFDKDFEIVGK